MKLYFKDKRHALWFTNEFMFEGDGRENWMAEFIREFINPFEVSELRFVSADARSKFELIFEGDHVVGIDYHGSIGSTAAALFWYIMDHNKGSMTGKPTNNETAQFRASLVPKRIDDVSDLFYNGEGSLPPHERLNNFIGDRYDRTMLKLPTRENPTQPNDYEHQLLEYKFRKGDCNFMELGSGISHDDKISIECLFTFRNELIANIAMMNIMRSNDLREFVYSTKEHKRLPL